MNAMDPNPYESPRGDAAGPNQKAIVPPPSLPEGFKDRSTGLMLFGALEIILGVLAALMVPLMGLSVAMQPPGTGTAGNVRTMIPAMVMYGLLAVVFIWLGIGSIQAKRWARALMLVLSWMWLVVGVLGMLWLTVVMSAVFSQIGQQEQVPAVAMAFGMLLGGGCAGCMYVFLPAALILFYRSEHVKATCEVKDPHVRWTDKCPLPVLALVLMLGFTAFSMISSPAYNCVLPVFGVLVRGLPGAALFLINAILLGWLTVGTYRLKMSAWWGTVAFFAFWGLSAIITFSRVSMMEIYRGMDFPEEQLKMMRQMMDTMEVFFPWVMAVSMIAWLGYLIYVRKYFDAPQPAAEG
jgi:hypothetical protein